MTTATPSAPEALTTEEIDDPFALDLNIVTEVGAEQLPQACGTGDGCAPSCASSCASGA